MNNILTLFDLDHTLLPIDSDYEWGQFLVRIGAVDPIEFERRNTEFFTQYQAGIMNPEEYLAFALGTLAQFPRIQLDAWHQQFMQEVIYPVIRPAAKRLLASHQANQELIAIVTATNRFVTAPIAKALGVTHLIAALPEEKPDGNFTGKLLGIPTSGAGKIIHTENWLASLGKSLDDFERINFYSDSHNDIPLLERATHPVATNPNAKLLAHAQSRGWPLLHLFDD